MKKLIIFFAVIIATLSIGSIAYASEVLGDAVYSDIVTYINHYPIQSFSFNGETLIAAEDLRHFGYDVKWNEYKWTLSITRNDNNTIDVPNVTRPNASEIGKKAFTVTTTDVGVYIGEQKIPSYGGINGYTLIDANDLIYLDNVSVIWTPEVRALKIWVEDGLEMRDTMFRPVPTFIYYEYYNAPKYYYKGSYKLSDYLFLLSLSMITESGEYVNDRYGKLVITSVIDADGNNILKEPVSIMEGTTIYPYSDNFTDYYLSLFVILSSEDLYPKTATENGGIIKFRYERLGNEIYSDSIRVDKLPYGASQ